MRWVAVAVQVCQLTTGLLVWSPQKTHNGVPTRRVMYPGGGQPKQGETRTRTRRMMALGTNTPTTGVEIDADENEVKLAELIFSTRDPRMEVAMAPDAYDEAFCDYVTEKAEKSDDMEERVALKSLVEMIGTVKEAIAEQMREAESTIDVDVAEPTRVLNSGAEVLAAAQSISAPEATKAKEEAEQEALRTEAGLSGKALETYELLLERLLTAFDEGSLESEVEASYEECDYSLLALATGRIETDPRCGEIVNSVNAKAKDRLELAAQRLQTVLRAGSPEKMFNKITELAVRGALDRVLLELLEANRQQAEAAGATDAASLMAKLADRCRDDMDRTFDPPKKLLRALLRCGDDAKAREVLIRRAFEPKESIALGFDGQETQGGCDVEPPAFIAQCQTLIADFGNVQLDDQTELADQVRTIADQAEAIAIELFGESLTPREQQDRIWNEATTSVFDLEAAELAAESQGERMPWQDDSYDDMLPKGFDGQGVKRIGGT